MVKARETFFKLFENFNILFFIKTVWSGDTAHELLRAPFVLLSSQGPASLEVAVPSKQRAVLRHRRAPSFPQYVAQRAMINRGATSTAVIHRTHHSENVNSADDTSRLSSAIQDKELQQSGRFNINTKIAL